MDESKPILSTTNGVIRRLISSIEIWHINFAASIIVIVFVYWQFHSIFVIKERKQRNSIRTSKDSHNMEENRKLIDKEVGDELDTVYEHDNFLNESKAKEIRYRGPELTEIEMQKRSQLFYEMMKMRRSVRCFSPQPVPLKLMQNLIKTAGTAPSGANLQPWTFCLIQSDTIKHGIREIVEHEEQINYSRRMGAKWVLDVNHLNVNWNKPYLTEAPYIIVVMKQCYKIGRDGSREPTYYNEISTSIAIGVLLVAIQNAGLVTVTTTPLNAGGSIRDFLRRPINEKVLLLLPVGYPATNAHVPDIKRKCLEDILRIY